MKTNNITHTIRHEETNLKMTIEISLNDECKNGHADFSITAFAREYYGRRWQDSFCGCCHDEILKRYPKLKMFVDLHLSDSNGFPMHAIENGFYHLWNESKTEAERFKIVKEYLRINTKEVKHLAKTKCKDYFKYTIEKMGLPQRWKKEAKEAIKTLEKLSGQRWDTSYKWERANYKPMTRQEKAIVADRVKNGYYRADKIRARENKARQEKIKKQIADIKADLQATIKKEGTKAKIKIWLIEKINRLTQRDKTKTFLMSFKNTIYYNHSNELHFNWVSYEPMTTAESFKKFCNSINEREFQRILPNGIKFVLRDGQDKKVLEFARG